MRLPPHVEGRMGVTDEARNVPQNAIGKYFADKLYGGRNFLNEKFGIPFVDTGLGLGDMFMAEGPEYIEELSWGRPFIEPTGHGFRLDTRLGDILGLPLPYAGGAALLKAGGKASIRGLSKGLNKMNPVDVSRRTFNKGLLGTIAAAGIAAKGIPLGLKDIAKPLATDVARTAAPAVARTAAVVLTNNANMRLAQLMLASSNPQVLFKAFKEGGGEGLQKAIANVDHRIIEFPDMADLNHPGDWDSGIDLNEIKKLVDNPNVTIARKFQDPKNLPDFEFDSMFEAMANGKTTSDDVFAAFQSNGFDALDVAKYIEKMFGKLPKNIKQAIKELRDDPDAYYKKLDKIDQKTAWNKWHYFDESKNSPNDGFYLEPTFLP